MKDFLKHNRAFAVVCLVVLVVLSVWADTAVHVSRLSGAVEKSYSDKSSSVQTNVKRLADAAYGLNVLAADCGAADLTFADAVNTLKNAADEPFGQADAVADVLTAASTAFTRIRNSGASDSQKATAAGYLTAIRTAFGALAGNEAYGESAEKYNRALSSLIPSILCRRRDPVADYSDLEARFGSTYDELISSAAPADPDPSDESGGGFSLFALPGQIIGKVSGALERLAEKIGAKIGHVTAWISAARGIGKLIRLGIVFCVIWFGIKFIKGFFGSSSNHTPTH